MKIYIASKLFEEDYELLSDNNIDYDSWVSNRSIDKESLILNLKDKDILIGGVDVKVDQEVLDKSSLKMIANVGDGVSNIDVEYAKSKGIIITNAPTRDSIASTAEMSLTAILAISRNIVQNDKLMRNHQFQGWSVTGTLGGNQFYGKKLLIVGLGRIGKVLVEMVANFQLEIYYADPIRYEEFEKKYNLNYVSLEEGLKIADYISLNCDLNKDNNLMIQLPQLQLMKDSAYLINCARGPLVKEEDLVYALKNNIIKGAALDVYEFEPKISNELASLDNVVLTPHIGNATDEARREMANDAVEEALSFINDKPLRYQV